MKKRLAIAAIGIAVIALAGAITLILVSGGRRRWRRERRHI